MTYTGHLGLCADVLRRPERSRPRQPRRRGLARALEALPTSLHRDQRRGRVRGLQGPGTPGGLLPGLVAGAVGAECQEPPAEGRVHLRAVPARTGDSRPAATSTSPVVVAVNAIAGLPADVHTNSNVIGINNSMNVTGALTASGTLSGCSERSRGGLHSRSAAGAGAGGEPACGLPGLRPDHVRSGTTSAPTAPCGRRRRADPARAPTIVDSPYNNWVYTAGNASTPGTWTLHNTATQYPGVYYVLRRQRPAGRQRQLQSTA